MLLYARAQRSSKQKEQPGETSGICSPDSSDPKAKKRIYSNYSHDVKPLLPSEKHTGKGKVMAGGWERGQISPKKPSYCADLSFPCCLHCVKENLWIWVQFLVFFATFFLIFAEISRNGGDDKSKAVERNPSNISPGNGN